VVGRPALHSTLAAVALVALLAGMTGCGSSGDSAGDSRTQVENVVRRSLTQNDPAFCVTATTPRYLNQIYGDSDDPLEQCRYEAVLPGEPSAREVSFESVRVDRDQAETTVALTGGSDDGSVLRIELVREGDRWRFDRLADIQIDRARSDAASRRDLEAYGITAQEADCAVKRVHRFFDTDQLERAVLKGETDAFAAAEALCLRRRSLIDLFELGLRKAAPKDLPDQLVDCITRRLTKGASTPLLRALFVSPDELEAYAERAAEAAAKACAKDAEAGLLPEPAPI
jgi:hypothetical protein